MSGHLPMLLAFWAAFGLAVINPGPNFAFMLKVGLGRGRRVALRTVLGIAVGEAVWGLAAVLGVAALALRYPWLAHAIRLAGGAFLFWLAFGALRSAMRPAAGDAVPPAAGGGFLAGLAIMLLNPKAGLFWVAVTGVLLGSDIPSGLGAVAVAGAVLLSLAWHTTLALAFTAGSTARLYTCLRRGIEAGLGVALAGLGVRLLAPG